MDKQTAIDEFFDEEQPKRKSLRSFFRTMLRLDQEGEEEEVLELNEFSEFLEDIPDYVEDEDYENIREITRLCTRSLNIIKSKMKLLANSRSIEREIHNTKYVADLSDEDVTKLKRQMDLFLNLSQENTRLMYQVTSFNKSVSELQGKSDLAVKALPEIEHSERQSKLIKSDIYLIESERSEIFDKYDKMNHALELIDKYSIVGFVAISAVMIFLIYLNVVNGVHVFFYVAFLMVVVIVGFGGMYIAKLKLRRNIKLNVKKQARAVELLNKKNAVLAHHTNFLNYEYKKFKAANSVSLRSNLQEYEQYKKVANRKTATRRALEESEADIKDFFKERGKSIPNISIEKFVGMIDIENKKMHYDRLVLERVKVEEEVERLDLEQEEIWEKVEYLQATIPVERNTIGDILKAYYSKLDKVMNNYKDVFDTDEEYEEDYDDEYEEDYDE